MEPEDRVNHLESAAQTYAHRGWPVIPLYYLSEGQCSCSRPNCPSPGKHPLTAHGITDATTDKNTIAQWWDQWPDANIGIATGRASGLVVLDIDPDKGGEESLGRLEQQLGPLPPTLRQWTGGGGFHLFFGHPSDQVVRNSAGMLGPGLDVRGEGGYCVVPPSLHISGMPYAWDGTCQEPAEMPSWILHRMESRDLVPVSNKMPNEGNPIPQGQRNSVLASFAGSMRRRGMSRESIETALTVENIRRCDPPLSAEEVGAIAHSISRYEPQSEPPIIDVEVISDTVPWRCSEELLAEAPLEIKWLIHERIACGAAYLFAGREGCMKTWLALDIAHAVAEGLDWVGMSCLPARVLYLDAEMPGDLFRLRIGAMGTSPNLHVWRWQDPSFPDSLDDAWLKKAAQQFELIIIDTLKRFMGSFDENCSADMSRITGQLRELTRNGATVVILHHGKKDTETPGYRGSSELGAGVDAVYYIEKVTREGRNEQLKITSTKDRYRITDTFCLEVDNVEGGPVFHMADAPPLNRPASAPKDVLARLSRIIADLTSSLGKKPNQSDISRHGQGKSMSRRMVLQALLQGEGTYWVSSLDGRARVYELLSHCSPVRMQGGVEGQDNGACEGKDDELSHCLGGVGLDNGTDGQSVAEEACSPQSSSQSPQGMEGLSQQVSQ